MKNLFKLIGKRRTIIFLDLEGTQFSHEMIALGAYRADLDNTYHIKKIHKGIKFYVKAKNKIGHYVEDLTNIHQEDLDKKGITYKQAMTKLRKYCGYFLSKVCFCTFGTHDLRIIMKSLENSPDADESFCHYIAKNCIDLSAVVSHYITDEHGNPLSLVNNLKVFNVELTGDSHNPLTDAYHLLLLYKAFIDQKEVVLQEYKKVLSNLKTIPEPVRYIIHQLLEGNNVTPENFVAAIREYID